MIRAWTSCRVQANFHVPSHTGVGSNSIFCNDCKQWVHKKCSGLKRLIKDSEYRCTKFKELLPVLSSRHLSFKTCGCKYSSCVQSAMLHTSETWPLTKPNLQPLQLNDRSKIRQICNVKLQDIVTTRFNELLVRLDTEDLNLILKEREPLVRTCGMLQWCSQHSI